MCLSFWHETCRLASFGSLFAQQWSIFLMFSDPMCKRHSTIFAFFAAIDGSSISFLLLCVATKRKVIFGDLARRGVAGSESIESSNPFPFQLLLLTLFTLPTPAVSWAFVIVCPPGSIIWSYLAAYLGRGTGRVGGRGEKRE